MKKFVYIIDYRDEYGTDQLQCDDVNDVIKQLRYLIHDRKVFVVENVKLVEDNDRWHEEDIAFSSAQRIINLLGYKPTRMNSRNKRTK